MNRQKIILTAILVSTLLAGIAVDRLWLHVSSESKNDEKKPLYWVAPMDSSYRRNEPGKSPMGMDLVPVYAEGNAKDGNAGTVRISPVIENNLGIRVEAVKKGKLTLDIQTVGYVSFDEQRLLHVHSRVDGWVEKLSVTSVGDPVKKDQLLFELYSPELIYAQEEYVSSLKAGSGDLLRASISKLKALGISDRQISELRRNKKVNQQMAFYAERNGYVSELNVREGMFIQPATTVLSMGNLDTVWVIAEIFEHQGGWIEAGQSVEMTVNSYPGESWQGKVDYVYPVINAQTRTVRARIKFDNPDHHLKPDMFAQLTIHAGYRDNAINVPREAVIRDGRMSRVVKVVGDGHYRSSRIETGIEIGDRVEVIKGLKEYDKVVVSAQFLIDSESSITADLSRIEGDTGQEHNHD
ncbi:MAG: efflux RND transporter periplasmic adaptor subunit [Gammaproteobacteria bacterium]|nr:efflux RND transporter periplasmic adaptor subunit [Gammaproteobacteria bacterium]